MSAHFDDACYGFWRCDLCGRTLSVSATNAPPQLPPPWREVFIEGFVGAFHVCKDEHETALRRRLGSSRFSSSDD